MDPQFNPVTGRPYDDTPFCDGPMTPVAPDKTIELNGGARVSARELASWEGSYACTLPAPGPLVRVDVRLAGGAATCHGPPGGELFAAAAVSLHLTETDGSSPSDSSCVNLATVAAWPGGTNLRIDCGHLIVEIRQSYLRIDRLTIENGPSPEIGRATTETRAYIAECQPATDDG